MLAVCARTFAPALLRISLRVSQELGGSFLRSADDIGGSGITSGRRWEEERAVTTLFGVLD